MRGSQTSGWILLLPWVVACAAQEPCPVAPTPHSPLSSAVPSAEVAPAPPVLPTPAPAPVLPSWRDGAAKQRIVDFVKAVKDETSTSYVPPEERIAVFDNDGTLWSEQPLYFQFVFAIERVAELLGQKPAPAWANRPWAVALARDGKKALAKLDEKAIFEIAATSELAQTSQDFDAIVDKWLDLARHPRFERPYDELVFQPMVELLGYLQDSGFSVYIVTGGSVRFVRAFAEEVYGVPPERVIGSYFDTQYEYKAGKGRVLSLPKPGFIDDGAGKPVAIDRVIGQVPIFAAGNSDGDREMLEYVTSQGRPSLGLLVHHDDAEREWAYDRASKIGKLDKALDQAASSGWLVVSMKDDFATVHSAAKPVVVPGP